MVEFSPTTDPAASLTVIDPGSAAGKELTTREPDGAIKVPFDKLKFSSSPYIEMREICQPDTFKGADLFVFVKTISYALELRNVVFPASAVVFEVAELLGVPVGAENGWDLLPSSLPKQDERSVHSPRSAIFGAGVSRRGKRSDGGAPFTQLPLIFM